MRRRNVLRHLPGLFLAAAGVSAALLAAAVLVVMTGGLPERVPAQVRALEAFLNYPYKPLYREGTCFLRPEQGFAAFDQAACLPKGSGKSIVLWGDSLAAHYSPGFAEVFASARVAIGEITASACAPTVGLVLEDRPNCEAFNRAAYDLLISKPPTVVVLSAHWARTGVDLRLLNPTIDGLLASGIKVMLLGPGPFYNDPVPTIAARRIMAGAAPIGHEQDFYEPLSETNRAIKALVGRRSDIVFVPILDELCGAAGCPLLANKNTPFHWDQAHFTREASIIVTERLTERLRAMLK